ncbi:ZIP zinc transporter-domain-containing protein [Stachybotrys elegans]|uniref:ZIP zinc transporter-domain-containing protein n=1 Tax=Stachybotrys elegans TaxID=80388 RepID=A0A8K0WWW4_9HYPO|nr:ZIP zinc transporter-domain-containing protein [Stachybotrys elegans]
MDLATRGLDNDTRGWIMCIVSGIACIFGAAIVCVDVIVRMFPGKRDFRIQDSNVFLACSLSLSFGVMIFSSLFSMLPESRSYLHKAGWSDQAAGLLVVACFTAGFFGIQVVSRLLHQFMPSHVVDCDHTHDQADIQNGDAATRSQGQSRASRGRRRQSSHAPPSKRSIVSMNGHHPAAESTPLLASETSGLAAPIKYNGTTTGGEMVQRPVSPLMASRSRATSGNTHLADRKPSMLRVQKRVMSFVRDVKSNCDELGSCYGYSDPCGQECFKHLSSRSTNPSRHPTLLRTTTGTFYPPPDAVFHDTHDHGSAHHDRSVSPTFRTSRATSREPLSPTAEVDEGAHSCQYHHEAQDDDHHHHDHDEEGDSDEESRYGSEGSHDVESQHHHHVPTNAFLSIGLQTSIAIALHKFPEGFITYATNHANPTLGFNVFMALFVHNITEGFAMCLPLYMALGSRLRAIAWSSLLGGLSQPVGAAIAVLWFKLARKTHMAPNEVAYGCIFAVTAGIMVSVALQLFVEGLSLNHNRNLSIFFGFLGMALLSLSNALFAGH